MTQTFARPEIHPRLAEDLSLDLLRPDRLLWTARELAALTESVATHLDGPLHSVLRYHRDQRWWARLALTEGVELWLLSWLPGQHTAAHDHGGASGSFTVLEGRLSEEYRYPGTPIRLRSHLAGDTIGFGAGRAHQVRNTSEAPSASVHAYSPPLVPTRDYASLADVPAEIPALA